MGIFTSIAISPAGLYVLILISAAGINAIGARNDMRVYAAMRKAAQLKELRQLKELEMAKKNRKLLSDSTSGLKQLTKESGKTGKTEPGQTKEIE